jgi:hypothetical protein
MKGEAMKNQLANAYTANAFTHDYILTFNVDGFLYAYEQHMNADELASVAKLDKASRGNGYSLRFRPTNSEKRELVRKGAKRLMSTAAFIGLYKSHKYNRGETAEMIVTEQMFGQTWEKDSVPFNQGADIYTDDKAYQHKHEGATFCNEGQLARL